MSTGTDTPPSDETPARPVLRLVRGSKDGSDVTVELAALVAVLAARSGGETPSTPLPSDWAAPRARMRRTPTVQVDGWRRSAFPV